MVATKPKAIAKTVKKTPTQSVNGVGVFGWLFSPAPRFGWGKFALRIALFMIGFVAATSLFMAISVKLQMVLQGLPVDFAGFWTRLSLFPTMLWAVASVNPFAFILFLIFLIIVGGFVFMPRPTICRYGYLATHWTSFLWTVIATGIVACMVWGGTFGNAWLLSVVAAIAILGVLCTFITTARFAGGLGVSNWALGLSFPFGFVMYALIGHFTPANHAAECDVVVTYKWYDRAINYLTGALSGRIILGTIFVLILLSGGMPGADIMAILFAVLMAIIGSTGILKRVGLLSWIAVAVNLITIIGIAILLELYPVQIIQMALM